MRLGAEVAADRAALDAWRLAGGERARRPTSSCSAPACARAVELAARRRSRRRRRRAASTRRCAARTPPCWPSATSPRPRTPAPAGACASSTGATRSPTARSRAARSRASGPSGRPRPGFWTTIGDHTLKHSAWGDGFDEARVEADGRRPSRRALPAATARRSASSPWATTTPTRPRSGVWRTGDERAASGGLRARARRGGAHRAPACARWPRSAGVARDAYEVLLVLDGCTDATRERAAGGRRRPAPARRRAPAARRRGGATAGHGPRLRAPAARRRARRPRRHHRRRLRGRARLAGARCWRPPRGGARAIGGEVVVEGLDESGVARAPRRPSGHAAARAARAPRTRTSAAPRSPSPPPPTVASAASSRTRRSRTRPSPAPSDGRASPSRGSPTRACAPRRAPPAAPSAASRATWRSTTGSSATPTGAATWTRRSSPRARPPRVSVVVPARDVAGTIGATVAVLRRFVDAGAVDELLVVDAASARRDGGGGERRGRDGRAGGRADARLRALPRQGRRDVARAGGDDRRHRRLRRRRQRGLRRAPAHRPARTALRATRARAGQGRLPAALRGRAARCATARAAG